jgi:hypothetical protein
MCPETVEFRRQVKEIRSVLFLWRLRCCQESAYFRNAAAEDVQLAPLTHVEAQALLRSAEAHKLLLQHCRSSTCRSAPLAHCALVGHAVSQSIRSRQVARLAVPLVTRGMRAQTVGKRVRRCDRRAARQIRRQPNYVVVRARLALGGYRTEQQS